MNVNKLLIAASLGLALAACAGEQADTTAAEVPAAGEIPQAGDEGIVTGSPAENVIGDETTTADASTLADPTLDPAAPPATVDPMLEQNPATVDPAVEGAEIDPSVPPPSQ